jgi:stress-induced-phosphoprotein 1
MFNDLKSNPQTAFQKYAQDPRMRVLMQALLQSLSRQFGGESHPPTAATAEPLPVPQGTEAEREKNQGNEAFRAGELEEALVHYDRAIELEPHNVTFYNNKAVVLSKQGRYEEAIALVNLRKVGWWRSRTKR